MPSHYLRSWKKLYMYVQSINYSSCSCSSYHNPYLYLWTELFWWQLECSYDLFWQEFSVRESEREEHDLSNHGVVRYHHSDRTEQGFEVIREFRATGISGVHRDEHSTRGSQGDLHTFKHEPWYLYRYMEHVYSTSRKKRKEPRNLTPTNHTQDMQHTTCIHDAVEVNRYTCTYCSCSWYNKYFNKQDT